MSTQTMIKIWHECKQTVAHHIFIYYVGSETRSTEGQFNWHTVRNLPFVVKHHQLTWKTGWLNSTYSSALFLATTKSAALVTTVNMYEVCWCCVSGSYLTARVLMLPVVTISTEMNTRNCVVSVLHIAARTDILQQHTQADNKDSSVLSSWQNKANT